MSEADVVMEWRRTCDSLLRQAAKWETAHAALKAKYERLLAAAKEAIEADATDGNEELAIEIIAAAVREAEGYETKKEA